MARKPRKFGSSGFYHVILRGNNRQNLFNDNQDRKFFISRLRKYSKELGITVHAYCLMNNHVHVLIGNATEHMSLLVQKIANSYVFYFNRKYERCGHLFQGRFKSEPILDEVQFKTVYRYVIQNCEKAGIEKTERYEWNSFWAVKKYIKNSFVDFEYVCSLFGSRKELLDFLSRPEVKKCMEYENIFVLPDDRAVKLIKRIFGICSPYNLERLPLNEQSEKCNILKKLGLSISQISRITGISRRIVRGL